MEEPLPLVIFDGRVEEKSGKFRVNEEAAIKISKLPRPIGTYLGIEHWSVSPL
jgi:hypothetical protein